MSEPLKTEHEDQCRAEESIMESEAMYRSAFDNMPIGFAYCRMTFEDDTPTDFVYLSVNKAFEKQTGLMEVIGRRAGEVVPGIWDSDPGLLEIFGRVALSGNPEQFETYVAAQKRWYRISASSPAREHFAALFEDITACKQSEKELLESEERFKLALRGANEGLWDWDVKNERVYYSPRWKSILGYADEELENSFETWKRLVHPQDQEPALARVHDFLEGRSAMYENEFRMRHKEGHYLDILSRGFPIYDDQGNALRMVGTHVDITERKKLEEQYRQAQKMEAIGQLAGGLAHDFNNILTAIMGYSHLILNKFKENALLQNYVEEIIAASKKAASLTQGLLAFSRKQTVTLALIDLNEAIMGYETLLRRLIREDIELRIICADDPLPVLADSGQIEQVIMNLVANARDAMPDGGRLSIETHPVALDQRFVMTHGYGKPGAYALITVSDSGIGMAKDTQSHIFEPFFTTKELGKGTGLGLAMAYGIVKKHEGFINVYSEPGSGTIFRIYLPRVLAEARADERLARESVSLQGGTETILLGEDDEPLRRLSKKVLSHYGYRVIEAVDGQDAVERFMENRDCIHLVILDAIMPRKNGREACKEMKAMRPELKTIFVSGYASDIFAEDNMFDENTIFFQKPISPDALLAKVREMLDRR